MMFFLGGGGKGWKGEVALGGGSNVIRGYSFIFRNHLSRVQEMRAINFLGLLRQSDATLVLTESSLSEI